MEEIAAPVFVNACGPWSGKIVDLFASRCARPHSISPLPVKPRKRSVFMFHRKPNDKQTVCSTDPDPSIFVEEDDTKSLSPRVSPLVIDPSGVWFRSEGCDGNFICGMSPLSPDSPFANPENGNYINSDGQNILTHDPDCDNLDALTCPDYPVFDEFVWPTLYARVPAFGDLKLKTAWAGFYEYNTFDQVSCTLPACCTAPSQFNPCPYHLLYYYIQNAIIGQHPDIPNLMLCNGFSGHGLQQSPAAGRAIAELLTEKRFQTIDLSRFSFDRILANQPIFEHGIV